MRKMMMTAILLSSFFASTVIASGVYLNISPPPRQKSADQAKTTSASRRTTRGTTRTRRVSGASVYSSKGCGSCHRRANLRFQRGKLIRVNIAGKIRSCSIHGRYCRGGRSTLSSAEVSALTAYLKRRYQVR